MKVGLTYDLKTDWQFDPNDPIDANAEFDKPQTIDFIQQALESGGHQVTRIGNAHKLLAQIDDLDVDIVFNICEGRGGRNRESQVPVILETKNIPCVGSDGLTLGITLDKIVAKKCFLADGIPTPRFFEAKSSKNLEKLNHIGFPLIVKAKQEGTSKGLSNDSRVTDDEGLKRQVDFITQRYRQSALVEEFIKGTEFTVAVLGNEEPQAMPVVQVSIKGKLDLGDQFYTFELVSEETSIRYVCPARIPAELTQKLQSIAVKAYQSVGCRDFGRVDFRVDEHGNPYVLEINPLPSLDKKDVFNLFPQVIGSTYQQTVNQVLQFGIDRYGLNGKSKKKTPNRKEIISASPGNP